jgi:hypothetical protein
MLLCANVALCKCHSTKMIRSLWACATSSGHTSKDFAVIAAPIFKLTRKDLGWKNQERLSSCYKDTLHQSLSLLSLNNFRNLNSSQMQQLEQPKHKEDWGPYSTRLTKWGMFMLSPLPPNISKTTRKITHLFYWRLLLQSGV